jgi:REP element-mobilizing transposase RayT
VSHVCNRGSRKGVILKSYDDYANFVALVNAAREKFGMRILAYNLLGHHFHFVLWPRRDNDLPRFMKWLEQMHAQRFHRKQGTVGRGAVYQGRYESQPISEDRKPPIRPRRAELGSDPGFAPVARNRGQTPGHGHGAGRWLRMTTKRPARWTGVTSGLSSRGRADRSSTMP